MLSPIWLGAVAISVIAGFFMAPRAFARISPEARVNAPWHMEAKGKSRRYKLDEVFLKGAIPFNPYRLSLIGFSLLFGLVMAAVPLFKAADNLTQILIACGVLGGTILGSLAGWRVLTIRIEHLLGTTRSKEYPGRVAHNVAVGFAYPGLVALTAIWVMALLPNSGCIDFSKSLGLNGSQTAPQIASVPQVQPFGNSITQLAPSDSPAYRPPTLTNDNLIPRASDPATPSVPLINKTPVPPPLQRVIPQNVKMKIPEGFLVPRETLSPNGRYGVLTPDFAHYQKESRGQNVLLNTELDTMIAKIDAESWFKDPRTNMNYASPSPRWSADGMVLAWLIEGKWSPLALTILKIEDGGLAWQTDLIPKVQQEILSRTRAATPIMYDMAKQENTGNGTAYPDGFVVDIKPPDSGFTLPLTCVVTLNSNPKSIEGKATVKSSLNATLLSSGYVEFSNFVMIAGGHAQPVTDGEDAVRDFMRQHVRMEQSHNLDQIMTQYAERVTYWDKSNATKDYIRRDKAEYFARWPEASEQIIEPIAVTRNGGGWVAEYTTDFKLSNPVKGKTFQGTQKSTITAIFQKGQYLINSENGKVLSKLSSNYAPPFPNMQGQPDAPGQMVGERFPETRTRLLMGTDFDRLSLESLRYAINEMFARHGAEFPQAELNRHFNQFRWYTPRHGLTFDQIEVDFTDIEKTNLKLLGAIRDAKAAKKR